MITNFQCKKNNNLPISEVNSLGDRLCAMCNIFGLLPLVAVVVITLLDWTPESFDSAVVIIDGISASLERELEEELILALINYQGG